MAYNMKIKLTWLLTLVCSCLCTIAMAQQNTYLVDKTYNGMDLPGFINKTEQDLHVRFFYQKDSLPAGLQIQVENDSTPLEQVLTANLKPYHFFVTVDANGNVFLTKGAKLKTSLPSDFFNLQQPRDFNSD